MSTQNKTGFLKPLIYALIFCVGMLAGNLFTKKSSFFGSDNHSIEAKEKLISVIDLINSSYVDDITIDSLVEMTIPELLANLDPHSAYIPLEDVAQANSELDSKFSGIGISFQIVGDTLTVVEVISGGPAEKVGVLPGDRIIKVDDRDLGLEKITNDDVFKMLRGDKGTHVSITVKRSHAPKPLVFEITRDDIPVESVDVAYMIKPSIGYIRVNKFASKTYEEFLQALNKLRLQGATHFIVDLRSNGGGYMQPALLMANEFLAPGSMIMSARGRNEKDDYEVTADGTGAFTDYGVTVLIDEFSASASEIFTGAIQDNDRGRIIGRRSFGKGLVQQQIDLADGSEIRLTIQRYYTPSGRCIQKDYSHSSKKQYEEELLRRFINGESVYADSIKQNTDLLYHTVGGRPVYGGGGIMPDIFVPEDTTSLNTYSRELFNQSMHIKFAYEYCDANRQRLQKARTLDQLLDLLPSDNVLLDRFANFAAQNGINKRPAYLYESRDFILDILKANIARNILGIHAAVEYNNRTDKTVLKAIETANKPLNQ